MKHNVYSGVDLFAVKFYIGRVAPINHSWRQETRGTALLDSEDCISLCSLVLAEYWHVMDSQTDGRTDGFAVAYIALAKPCFAERCRNEDED